MNHTHGSVCALQTHTPTCMHTPLCTHMHTHTLTHTHMYFENMALTLDSKPFPFLVDVSYFVWRFHFFSWEITWLILTSPGIKLKGNALWHITKIHYIWPVLPMRHVDMDTYIVTWMQENRHVLCYSSWSIFSLFTHLGCAVLGHLT